MDFMYLDRKECSVVDFDVKREIVAKDRFFSIYEKYICFDEATLIHRQSLFSDIKKNDGLPAFLSTLFEKLKEYKPLMCSTAENTEHMLSSILYPTAFVELTKFIFDFLNPIILNISSASLKQLYETAKKDVESLEYQRLEQFYKKKTDNLLKVNSVTVGINLDTLYQPKEAGIISLNSETYKSGDLLDRIIKLDFSNDEFHCIAPITTIDKKLGFRDSQQVNFAFLKAMEKVLNNGLNHCSNRSLNYVKNKLKSYYEWFDSLDFVVDAIKRIRLFEEKGIQLCFPKISRDGTFVVESLYDSDLCQEKNCKDIVPNTVKLNGDVCCYILTGPNSGGKTVFINSLAAAQFYFQLGMPIPAKEAMLPICDSIFKISPSEYSRYSSMGRFEQECSYLSDALARFTTKSLMLLDEPFTSTSVSEAIPLSINYITNLCDIGGKCIYVTHYYELCDEVLKINECVNKVDFLCTEVNNGQKYYKIKNGRFTANNYAQNIAKTYGLL